MLIDSRRVDGEATRRSVEVENEGWRIERCIMFPLLLSHIRMDTFPTVMIFQSKDQITRQEYFFIIMVNSTNEQYGR